MARIHYRIFPSIVAGSGFDNLAAIERVRAPVLLIHGTADRIIPAAMGRELASRLGERADVWLIEGADHNETYELAGEEYPRRFKEFVARVTR
jgi:hypothetical protein